MRQLSSRCTGHFGIFTLTSRRCLAAGRRGSTAVIISRPCWYSLGSGATLRTCRRRFRGLARGMQRFLTDSPWDDEVSIGRLQEYLGTRLEHPEGVWVLDGSDFPKQGRKSVGVARQYCGRLGKVANCQAGMFLAYVSPLGRALVDKGCICPRVGPPTKTGVLRRVCRRTGRATGPRRSWPWRWWSGHRSWAT